MALMGAHTLHFRTSSTIIFCLCSVALLLIVAGALYHDLNITELFVRI